MRAELLLKVAADPRVVTALTTEDICELLVEDRPPAWVFEEAARRTGDERVMAHLFSHPAADPELLRRAVCYDLNRCERFHHHVAVYTGPPPTLTTIVNRVVPEVVRPKLTTSQEHLLVTYFSPLCLAALRNAVRGEASTVLEKRLENEVHGNVAVVKPDATALHSPRGYAPSARFLLLGDLLYYLTCRGVETVRDLPVLAKVALALNDNQPSTLYLEDADVRVRVAARERDGTRAELA